MTPFDADKVPLNGVHLIEAGAGTGKTYTIAALFLRLIVEQAIPVDRILVVTYTKAAAEELKTRIRGRLVRAKSEWRRTSAGGDAQSALLMETAGDRATALRRVSDALIDFDRSAIFTIHGFCQRVLNACAFETGHLFESELVQDSQPYIQEAADDFWRRNISRAPYELGRYILDKVKGPEELAGLFHRRRSPLTRVIPPAAKPRLTAIRPWRDTVDRIKAMWPNHRHEIISLLLSPGLNGRTYGVCEPDKNNADITQRQVVVTALADAMDQWSGSYPLFKRFDRFCADCLAKATRKNQRTPRHPFFDLCNQVLALNEELEQQLADYWKYLKVRLLAEFHQRLEDKKRTANIVFFDDLLLLVRAALLSGHRRQLTRSIQAKYQAALVDEFQDTDALQYDIFSRLFGAGQSVFFMIGDPKQAIYSFRGADIFSYLEAKEAARGRYTLARNFRSTPALIQAINAIFGLRARPFGYEKIKYEPAVAADGDAQPDETPFRLWCLTRGDEEDVVRPLSQHEAVQRILSAVAEEVVALLSRRTAPSCAPEEIAVLTRTHRQAQQMKAALARRGVPAVLHSAGSVFETPEAAELALVLQAVANPADPRRVRAALSGDLFGVSAREIDAYQKHSAREWETRWARFETYHHLWQQHGFYRMFNHLMIREEVTRRVVALPDGERRLTNLLHLSELLHQAAVEHQLGPEALLKWFAVQRQERNEDEETRKLRLESDARAVRIITIHKSKGLQFQVVFCPFTWAGARTDDQAVNFHDPGHEDRLTLAIGPGIDEGHKRLALEEELAENLRMLYVALTRARRRCYMVWGCINGSELSAPAYLLHSPVDGFDDPAWAAALKRKMAAMTDRRLIAELDELALAARGAIAVEPLPESSRRFYRPTHTAAGTLHCRTFHAGFDHRWRMASFTAMTAERPSEALDLPDRDTLVDTTAAEMAPAATGTDDLFDFPKGARAGLFFHDVLEHWDFSDPDRLARKQAVADKLAGYGFEGLWADAVDRMLERLIHTPLPVTADASPLFLRAISMRHRVNEMEFYFPLKPVSAERLKQTLAEQGGRFVPEFSTQMDRLNFAPMEGFMKGYMDMVFEHRGRYYLVDWKSNHLGNTWPAYEPAALKRAVAQDYYFLQYYLYVVALDQLLHQRIRNYHYEKHFGGVYYIFLRGLQGAGGVTGIYHDTPDRLLVAALKHLLIDQPRNPKL